MTKNSLYILCVFCVLSFIQVDSLAGSVSYEKPIEIISDGDMVLFGDIRTDLPEDEEDFEVVPKYNDSAQTQTADVLSKSTDHVNVFDEKKVKKMSQASRKPVIAKKPIKLTKKDFYPKIEPKRQIIEKGIDIDAIKAEVDRLKAKINARAKPEPKPEPKPKPKPKPEKKSIKAIKPKKQKTKMIKKDRKITAGKSSLHQIISRTLSDHPDVVSYLKDFLIAEHEIDIARSTYYPTLDLRGSYGEEKRNSSSTYFINKHFSPTTAKIVLSQNIFSGFYSMHEVSRNKHRTLSQKYLLEAVASEVALLVTNAYLNVLKTDMVVDLARDNYDSHLDTFAMIEQRSEKGLSRKADTEQASGRLALAKANLIATENNYQDALAMFKRITGFLEHAKELKYPSVPNKNLIPLNKNLAQKEALSGHPKLKSADADIKEARAQHDVSKANNYPHLNLVGEAAYGHDISGVEGRNSQYNLYLQLNYNLFSGGRDVARQRETSEMLGRAYAIRDRTYREVIENMQFAWNFYDTKKQQMKYFLKHESAALATVQAYSDQFKIGRRTLLDLLDSEDELFRSRVDTLNGKINLLQAKFRILNAKGKLLSYFGIDFLKLINSNTPSN